MERKKEKHNVSGSLIEPDTSDLEKQLEEVLLAEERKNEDNFSLSHGLRARAKIISDIGSLLPPARSNPETVFEKQMSDEEFLDYKRRLAETNFIKSKILYKV